MNAHDEQRFDRVVTRDPDRVAVAPLDQEFLLAEWHVRPAHNCITRSEGRDGEIRQLEPRLMTLLCLLAAQPGEVLGRHDLMESLWPRVIVNENSLTRAVSDLRRQLRNGSDRRFIETVPKRGYKLVAPVSSVIHAGGSAGQEEAPVATDSHESSIAPPTSTSGGIIRWLQRRSGGLAAIHAALAIALVGLFNPFAPSGDGQQGREPTVTAGMFAGDSQATLARTSSAVWNGDRVLHGDNATYPPAMATSGPDNTGSNAAGMAVSPDGELVAFTRRTDEGSALMIGSLLDRTDPLQVYTSQHRIDHLHWSPVGTALLFSVLPAVSHAAMGEREEGRLMLFDLQDLSLRELYRSGHAPEDTPARLNDALNIT